MNRCLRRTGLFALFALIVTPGWSASHLWEINEMYSSSDGTIQYIELYNPTAANETQMATKWIKSDLHMSANFGFTLPPDSTTDKYLLLATTEYANLHPAAPQPDFTIDIPADFFETGGDEIHYWNYPLNDWTMLTFGAGDLRTQRSHHAHVDRVEAAHEPFIFPCGKHSADSAAKDSLQVFRELLRNSNVLQHTEHTCQDVAGDDASGNLTAARTIPQPE